jgi:uncharacterized protein YgfB (UPF0149 family)
MSDRPFEDSRFDWLANIYNQQGAITHPSELHGLLMGEFAGGRQGVSADWPRRVAEHMEVPDLDTSRRVNLVADLEQFYRQEQRQVSEALEAFQLLLPDDSYPMQERAEALIAWVSGFLEGISLAAGSTLVNIDPALEEVLRDFVEITQLDTTILENETSEKELFEVCEYVRIGVLGLYALFNPPAAVESGTATASRATLH